MCLAIPMKIKDMNGCEATCEAGGIEKDIRIDLIEDAAVGDYVMVHAGFAIEKMTEQQALENIHFLEEIGNAL